MKNIYILIVLILGFTSCETAVKLETQTGIIEGEDEKSLTIDAFNDAYLANDMTGQDTLFTDGAVAKVNSQEISPSEMIDAFMGGRESYDDIKNLDRATGTFSFDEGSIYTCTWFTWEGTSKSTGVVVSTPVHAWFKWEGDKVSEVTYIYDSAQYVANMSETE